MLYSQRESQDPRPDSLSLGVARVVCDLSPSQRGCIVQISCMSRSEGLLLYLGVSSLRVLAAKATGFPPFPVALLQGRKMRPKMLSCLLQGCTE